jgi:glycosyl hydrolase family 2
MLWFWSGRITDSLIDHQLAEMRSLGLAEVIISPVGAERLDLARVEHAQREAQRIGMRASLDSSHADVVTDAFRTRMLRLRHAASAAHLAGRARIPARLLVEDDRRLAPQEARFAIGAMAARGVNLIVLYAYWSDSGLGRQQPWWFAIGDLVTWTARVSDLAMGQSAAPMALLVPTPEREGLDSAFQDIVTKLEDAQADFDLLPEEALAQAKVRIGHLEAGSQRYRVVIVPPVRSLSVGTARRLAAFTKSGGTVIAWKPLPAPLTDWPSPGPRFRLLGPGARLIDTLIHTPFSTVREPGPPALRILPLERGEDHVFLLFNESDRRISVAPPFRLIGQPELWNPDDGSMRLPPTRWSPRYALTDVPLELEPFQVLGLVFRARPRSPKGPIGAPPTEDVVADATTGWRLRFATGDTTWRPVPALGSWNTRDSAYSGTGIYEGTLEVEDTPRRSSDRYLLDLGAVRDVAEVELNGKALGRRLWRPYRYDVTDIVRAGANQIKVRVTNTRANQMGTALPSGLLGPVIVIRVR